MSANSEISWTDHTFNPWWGCTKVSPACDHCYAERDAKRFAPGRVLWGVGSDRRVFGQKHWDEPLKWNAAALRAGRRARVFCASMADVFDKDAPDGARDRLFDLILRTPKLDWLLLTKRIGNVRSMLPISGDDFARIFPNVWLGATVVNQEEADRDIPKLLAVPARVRFLSIEPMLGPIDLSVVQTGGGDFEIYPLRGTTDCTNWDGEPIADIPALHWVIAGGESGPHARPAHPDWFRSLAEQCSAAGVPFHFKQWGEWAPYDRSRTDGAVLATPNSFDEPLQRFGKKLAGRLLDGIEHNGFPA